MEKARLSQEQWRRVEEVYHEALEHRPESRAAFVTAACGADSSLRREVESLLAADAADALVDQPAMDIAAVLLDYGAPLAPGTELGPYRIENLIGTGGMGRVYRARDTRLNRTVAIKISKQGFDERFEREARAVAALNHPHICQLYDIGPNYLVMEFVEGAALKGPLPLPKAVEYAGEILDALDAAHRKGVVHRDLKPANILVSKQGVKLLDFGLAKQVAPVGSEATVTKGLTVAGSILGTVQYMSPEQLQGKPVDARSDLFSFGCVLYEMLTGKRAFEGENPASVIAAVLEREPTPLEISPPLDRVVERCLAKDPDRRFQTAIDLKTALNWAVEQMPQLGKPARRWWIGGIAAASLALGLGIGAWIVSRPAHRPAAEGRPLHFQITPPKGPASYFGEFAFPSVSPDGRFVTYSASVNGRLGFWLHPLDGSADRLLVDSVTATNNPFAFWSPDGKSVGWISDHRVWRTDLSGGTPVVLNNTGAAALPGAVWTADGRILFGTTKGLMQIPDSGGASTPLTQVDASLSETGHSTPQLLPGGFLVYFASNAKPESRAIYAAPLSNPSKRVLVTRSSGPALFAPGGDGKDYLLTMRDQALVAQEFDVRKLALVGSAHTVVSQVEGARQLPDAAVSPSGLLLYSGGAGASRFVWVDRAGKTMEAVSELNRYGGFRLSPNGKRFVAQRGPDVATDLGLMDLDRHVFSLFAPTVVDGLLEPPVWSSDGRTVLFNARRRRGIYRKGVADSGEGERVMEWPAAVGGTVRRLCDWSRDGRFLLYETSDLETRRDLWVAPVTPEGRLAEGEQPKPYMRGPSAEWHGRFSPEPNPRWVAYESDETGRDEIYIASFPDAKRRLQVTSSGGSFPQWGPDGRELFYVSGDGMLTVVSLKNGAEGLEASPPLQLFPLRAISVTESPYEVSPDGKRILVNQVQPITELDAVVNWPLLLRGQAAQ
jgi:Tol biopolymer transport system component/predicted Ser/Thr protein kinase